MEINLQSVEATIFADSQRAIFNVLKATLQYPAKPQEKAIKLADDVIFFCRSVEDADDILWIIWFVVLDIASCIPPGHSWQDSLVLFLDNLRHRDGAIPKCHKSNLWKDLPDLPLSVREKWNAPVETGEDEKTMQEFAHWKSLNSFIARFTSTGFAPWFQFPVWQLREALEEPPVKGSAMECRIWVASEWIIHCADLIFGFMNFEEEPDERSALALGTGPLCGNEAPLSVERWKFWKKRFSKLAGDAGSLGLDRTIIERVSNALKSMDAVTD